MGASQALKDLSIRLSTPTKSPADTVNSGTPEDAAGKLSKFNAALNVALDQARQQRKDTTMDFMGGVVPKGALPATSFAGVLSAFNSASAPLEATLVDGAMSFAQKQMQISIDAKNNIRDLALKVAENGGSKETLASVLSFAESGDIDGAIKAAGAALAAASGDIQRLGNSLIKVEKDGTYEILYTAPKTSSGSGPSVTATTATLKAEIEQGLRLEWGNDKNESYANSGDYATYLQEWIASGRLAKDFYTAFSPTDYLNPKDPTVPEFLQREIKKPAKPAKDVFENANDELDSMYNR